MFWRVDGKKKTEYFKTARARNDKMAELERAAKRGTLALVPTRTDLEDWQAFKRAICDTPWQEVVKAWQTNQAHGRAVSTITVVNAVKAFLADLDDRVKNMTMSNGHVAHKRLHLGRFVDAFGSQLMATISGPNIGEWIRGLKFRECARTKPGEMNPGTFNSYRASVGALYEFSKVTPNPVSDLHEMNDRRGKGKIGINTVAEVAQLFAYAQSHSKFIKAIPRLSLEYFAGIRFSSAQRLKKRHIVAEDKGIWLVDIKTGGDRFMDGFPDSLWAWLTVTEEGWDLTESQWMHLKSDLFTFADVRHPHNAARHTMPTHHMAAFKNPGLIATLLVHEDQEQLWRHYNGLATQDAGKLYWQITPRTASTMAKDPAVLALSYPLLPEPPKAGPHPPE